MSRSLSLRSLRWSCVAALSSVLLFLSGLTAGRHWPATTFEPNWTHHSQHGTTSAGKSTASNLPSIRTAVTAPSSTAHTPAPDAQPDTDIASLYEALPAHAPDDISYAMALCDLTRHLDAEQLFLFLETHATLEQKEGRCDILRTIAMLRLAKLDPQLAVDELKALRQRKQCSSELRDNLFDYLVGVDAAEAARTALDYAADTGEYEGTFDHLLPKILDQDPDSVNDLAQTLLGADDATLKTLGLSCAQEYLGFLCKCMQRDQALAWIESTAVTPEQRTALLQSAIIQLTQTNDLDGARLAYRTLGSSADSDTVNILANALVAARPPEAMQFAATLAPGDIRGACLKEIVPKLLEKQDAAATFAWLQTLPAGTDLDSLYPTVAEALDKTDRAQAFACIESMSPDAKYRYAFRVQCAFGWLSEDQDRARQSLPPDLVSLWDRAIALRSQVIGLIPGMEGAISFKPVQTQ